MRKGYIFDNLKSTNVSNIRRALKAAQEIKQFSLDESAWVIIVESERNVDDLVRYAVEDIGKGKLRTKLRKNDMKYIENYLGRKLTKNPPPGWSVETY